MGAFLRTATSFFFLLIIIGSLLGLGVTIVGLSSGSMVVHGRARAVDC